MKVICINPQTDPMWQSLTEQYSSDVFQSPQWMQVIADTYGFNVNAYLLLDDNGHPVAGLPFCSLEDVKNKRIITLPFSDYCDPLVNVMDQWCALTEQVEAQHCSFKIRCLHNDVPLEDKRFEQTNKAKWHGLDLRSDTDFLWDNLHSSARRAIRKAEREGVVVRVAERKEELRAFFELHLAIRKYKYQLVAQPYSFFENIWHQFVEPQQGFLLTAYYNDQMVSGIFYLIWQNKLYYKFNASAATQLSVRPNDLLIWEGIKLGKSKGCTHLDFGLSDWDQEGLVRYKRKFATEEKTISFLQYNPNGGLTDQEKQFHKLLPQLTQLFTDESVPISVTEKAGEVLYKYFT
ncbi:MAG: GNAT family N-acetyltransferase [Anaerolineae bacterium]|nr:GNAT family N-acetyltransferase [Anaerolineae bacterium]